MSIKLFLEVKTNACYYEQDEKKKDVTKQKSEGGNDSSVHKMQDGKRSSLTVPIGVASGSADGKISQFI